MCILNQQRGRFPTWLRPGDKVRLLSPSSPPDEASVFRAREILQSWGLEVDLGRHVFSKMGYLAGTDNERISDLNLAFRDPSVRAIVATAGGKGAYRIADQIDFAAASADPKFLVGFSDITILQMGLFANCGLGAIHGALSEADQNTSLQEVLMGSAAIKIGRKFEEPTSSLTTSGRARGVLIGGNLDMIATAAGWALPKLNGAILLIEIVNQAIGAIDRQLSMLRKARHLEGLAGIAVGQFTNVSDNVTAMVAEHLIRLDVPILGGLPIGHGSHSKCVWVGAMAEIDAAAGYLTVVRPDV